MSPINPMTLHRIDRDELQVPLLAKACRDEAFKKALIADPKAAIEKQFRIKIPADIKITVLQEETNHFYLVLPPALPPFSSELGDDELEAVAGGKGGPEPAPKPEPAPAPTYERPKCACLCSGTTTAPGPEI